MVFSLYILFSYNVEQQNYKWNNSSVLIIPKNISK